MSEQIPENRVAVVTGASRDFGAQIVRNFAAEGWHTIAIARSEDRLQQLRDEVGGEYKVCDITDRTAVAETAEDILENHPSINVLVNNAGMPMRKRAMEAAELGLEEDINQVMDTHTNGMLWITNSLKKGLKRAAPNADVINMISAAAALPNPHSAIYAASKAAQLSLSHSMTTDLRPSGVRVKAILPGKANTERHPQSKKSSPLSSVFGTDTETVARKTVDMVGKRRKTVYIPRTLKPIAVVHGLAPASTTWVLDKLIS